MWQQRTAATGATVNALNYFVSRLKPHRPQRLDVIAQIAYDGTRFHGWQSQDGLGTKPDSASNDRHCGAPTIQGKMTAAISSTFGSRVTISGVSRTDTDVSSKGQLAWFGVPAADAVRVGLEPAQLRNKLNALLGPSVHVSALRYARPSQIILREAVGLKTYDFFISLGPRGPLPQVQHLQRHTVYRRSDSLCFDKMSSALGCLVGTHDYRFLSSHRRCRERTDFGEMQVRATSHAQGHVLSLVGTLVRPPGVSQDSCDTMELDDVSTAADLTSGALGNARSPHGTLAASAVKGEHLKHARPLQTTIRTVTSASLTLFRPEDIGDSLLHAHVVSTGVDGALAAGISVCCVDSSGGSGVSSVACITPAMLLSHPLLRLRVTGNGFLMHMVRKMTSAALLVGQSRLTLSELRCMMTTADALAHMEQVEGSYGKPDALKQARVAMNLTLRIPPIAGRGLVLQHIDLPSTFWSDLDYCNNHTPGYAGEYGISVSPSPA